MNKEIIETLFPEEYEKLENGLCPICGNEIDVEIEFEEDEAAIREYLISGLCKACQDKTFKEEDDGV